MSRSACTLGASPTLNGLGMGLLGGLEQVCGPRVLLASDDSRSERSLVRILREKRVVAERTHSVAELKARVGRRDLQMPEVVFLDLDLPDTTGEEWVSLVRGTFTRASVVAFGHDLNGERAARLLGLGVPSLRKPVDPSALANLALRLWASQQREPEPGAAPSMDAGPGTGALDRALESYAALRKLSNQQRLILGFYLGGENDKQIALRLACSGSTVYEHWRRMAKKAGGAAKSDVVSDFHRFLEHNWAA